MKNKPVMYNSVNYYKNINGFLAKPIESGNYPGIIMIHEWWGLNNNIKEKAKELAIEGYNVLAVDLFNGKVASEPDSAKEQVIFMINNPDEAIQNMISAIEYLKTDQKVDKIASLGWCFGGGMSLNLSLKQKLDATVIYYGSLVFDEKELVKLHGPVLGIFGSIDEVVKLNDVNLFLKLLNNLQINNEIHIYNGVGHAFANPTGMNYSKKETEDAWKKTLTFLNNYLK